MSNQSEYITFGATVVNLAAVVTMSEDEFKSMLKGVIDYDIDKAWREVLKHKLKQEKPKQEKSKEEKPTYTKKSKRKSYKKED